MLRGMLNQLELDASSYLSNFIARTKHAPSIDFGCRATCVSLISLPAFVAPRSFSFCWTRLPEYSQSQRP